NRVCVEVSRLTKREKESIFRRYFNFTFPTFKILDDDKIQFIIEHKNFSPETVRAYFDNNTNFDLEEFKKHLNLPDKYLEKVFTNLSQEKRIVLLSILFALGEDEANIAYTFGNICDDLNHDLLTSLKKELLLLDGSIISTSEDKYHFYHPSMFDFFVKYLEEDSATYRKLLFKNLNLNFLALSKFKLENSSRNNIEIKSTDIKNLSLAFDRIINNPYITLFEINSLFAWIQNPDVQLYFKIKLNKDFRDFLNQFYKSLSGLDFKKFISEDPYYLGTFFYYLTFLLDITNKSNFVPEKVIKELFVKRNNDKNYWLLVFRIIPFLEKEFIYENIGRDWLNQFYIHLKKEINSLGRELFGNAYPDFEEIDLYKRLIEQKKFKEAEALNKKSIADFKQDTNREWYPRYRICKEKMAILKSSHPYGYKIYQILIGSFEHLTLLEENQKNRYTFIKQKNWW
ncbi:MAG: hypothetical protein Q8M94_01490, partial [Ignavibacteria bacterium]|nr:hypothetical protein [Ignavibacteria bacterium]